MLSIVALFGVGDLITTSNVPLEEMLIPTFRNYDFYFDGAYAVWRGTGVSLHLNTVPGAARFSASWVLRTSKDTLRETFLLNYSRYLGILDLGFNMLLRRMGNESITPGAGINLSSYSRALKVGVGVSYLSALPLSYVKTEKGASFGIYLFSHRAYHRGGKGYNVAVGYSTAQGRGVIEGYVSYKWKGLNPFLTFNAPFGEVPFLLKVGLRLTTMRFRLQSGVLLSRDGDTYDPVGYVVSIGTEFPR